MIRFQKEPHTTPPNNQKIARSGIQLAKCSFYAEQLETIQSLAALTHEHYAIFYQAPLEKLLAIYQTLPTNMLQLKLTNIINALKLRRSHNLPFGVKPEDMREKKDIWTYAIFVAAMLHKLPNLMAYTIHHRKPNSDKPFQRWHPYSGAIPPGHHYRIEENSTRDNDLLSLSLLPVLFDASCTAWLYHDQIAFSCMLELTHAPDSESTLGQLIIQSHSQISTKNHIGHDLYTLLTEITKGNINKSDRANYYLSLTHDGYAVAIPDIFTYYGAMRKEDPILVEECFYSLKKHKPSSYKVTFPNIGKREAVLLTEIQSSL